MAGKSITFAPPLPHQVHPEAVAEHVRLFDAHGLANATRLAPSAARQVTAKSAVRATPATYDHLKDFDNVHPEDAIAGGAGAARAMARAARSGITEPNQQRTRQVGEVSLLLYPHGHEALVHYDDVDNILRGKFGAAGMEHVAQEYALGNFSPRKTLMNLRLQLRQINAPYYRLTEQNLRLLPPIFAKLPLPGQGVVDIRFNELTHLPTSLFAGDFVDHVTTYGDVLRLHAPTSEEGAHGFVLAEFHLAGNPVAELFKGLLPELWPEEVRDVMEFVQRFGLERLATDKVIGPVDLEMVRETMKDAREHEAHLASQGRNLAWATPSGAAVPAVAHLEHALGTLTI